MGHSVAQDKKNQSKFQHTNPVVVPCSGVQMIVTAFSGF